MKLLIAILFILTSSVATANTVDVLNSYRPGGSFYNSGVSLHEYNPDYFNEVTSVGSCTEALTILKHTNKPTIAIWDYLSHEIAKNNSCKIDENMFITTYVSAYYNFCSIRDNYDLEYLLTNNTKVGVADWYTVKTALSKTLKEIGSPSKIVSYSTSKDYLLALEIGEIDYVYTNRPTENMNCVLSNDPESDIKHTGDLYSHPLSRFSSDIAIIGVNVDKDEIQKAIVDSSSNSKWSKTFNYYKNEFGKLHRSEQLRVYKELLESFK